MDHMGLSFGGIGGHASAVFMGRLCDDDGCLFRYAEKVFVLAMHEFRLSVKYRRKGPSPSVFQKQPNRRQSLEKRWAVSDVNVD